MSSTTEVPGPRGPAEFERALAQSDQSLVVFEEESKSTLKRVQHFLHQYPTTVPFIVLLLGIVVFSAIVGDRFFAPFNLSLILQQVTIIGIVGIAQTLIGVFAAFAWQRLKGPGSAEPA
jgi:fructose transport system permease protein